MTAKKLIEELQKYPSEMEVFFSTDSTDFPHGSVEIAEKEKIKFSEEPGGKALSRHDVIVLKER